MTTAPTPNARIRLVARLASSRDAIGIAANFSASIRLGVTRRACGSNLVRISSMASSSSSLWPLVAIITGSTTTGMLVSAAIASQTAATTSWLGSIPVLIARTSKSATTVSICAVTSPAPIASAAVMPTVFWAVTAVMAQTPCTPCAANVFRSAWMPAPPPESLPAIVRAVCIGWRLVISWQKVFRARDASPDFGEGILPSCIAPQLQMSNLLSRHDLSAGRSALGFRQQTSTTGH